MFKMLQVIDMDIQSVFHLSLICLTCACRWPCRPSKVASQLVRRETRIHKVQSWDGTTRASSRASSIRYWSGKSFITETPCVVVADCCFHVSASFVEGTTGNAQPSADCGPGQGVSCPLSLTHAPDEDSDQPQRPPGAHAAPGPLSSAARESIHQHFWAVSSGTSVFLMDIMKLCWSWDILAALLNNVLFLCSFYFYSIIIIFDPVVKHQPYGL